MAKDKARDARESSIASGWTVEADADEQPQFVEYGAESSGSVESQTESNEPRTQLSAGALVLLGLIGGIYLLYTVVWFSWANFYSVMNTVVADGSGVVGSVAQQVIFWLAPLAPILWFVSVLILRRDSKLSKKLLWFLVGVVVLVPLPMFGGII